jgi:hypothetical protein
LWRKDQGIGKLEPFWIHVPASVVLDDFAWRLITKIDTLN